MKTIVTAAVWLACLAFAPSFAADLYRCDLPNGRTVYQSAQCELGAAQKAIDRKNARREQIRKSLQKEREQKLQKQRASTTAG